MAVVAGWEGKKGTFKHILRESSQEELTYKRTKTLVFLKLREVGMKHVGVLKLLISIKTK